MHANTLALNTEMLNSFSLFPLFAFPLPLQPETEQGRRTSLEKFTRSVVSVPSPLLLTLKLNSLKYKEFWCTTLLDHIPAERETGYGDSVFGSKTGAMEEN